MPNPIGLEVGLLVVLIFFKTKRSDEGLVRGKRPLQLWDALCDLTGDGLLRQRAEDIAHNCGSEAVTGAGSGESGCANGE